MGKYSSVTSPFIRGVIQRATLEDRGYVDDLIALDDLIDCKHLGFAGAVHLQRLTDTYPREYLSLLEERGSERLQRGLLGLLWQRARDVAIAEDQARAERELQADWLRAVGRI